MWSMIISVFSRAHAGGGDIGGHAGGMDEQLAVRRSELAFSLHFDQDIVCQGIICGLGVGDQAGDGIIDLGSIVYKTCQQGMMKGAFS